MVRVEPFIYQKITAFKERVQMVNKINEIIESLNGVFDESQVKEYVTNELLNYYTKSEVDEAIADIDFTPYATKDYVYNAIADIDFTTYATKDYVDDAIEDIDFTPYATNVRVDNEVETLDDKIDTKQDLISVTNPIKLSNNNIGFENLKFSSRTVDKWYQDVGLGSTGTGTLNTDVLLIIMYDNYNRVFAYLPKGTPVKNNSFITFYGTSGIIELGFPSIFTSSAYGLQGYKRNISSQDKGDYISLSIESRNDAAQTSFNKYNSINEVLNSVCMMYR